MVTKNNMKTLNDILAELQTVLADLQALATVPVAETIVSVETTDSTGATETFVPETEPTA